MKKIILFISIFVVLFLSTTVFAEECSIECTTGITGQNVCISGRITNVTESHQVTLLVGETDDILYINQVATTDDGSFVFDFGLPDTANSGSYNFIIGSSADAEPYEGILEYTADSRIICQTTINGRNVNISGQILNASETNNVNLLVGDSANVIYTGQTTSTNDGSFNFAFDLPTTLPSGNYGFTIDPDGDVDSYNGIFTYESTVEIIESQFFDGNIIVSISSYVPTIEGNVSCIDGKEITFNVVNSTDNTVVAQDIVTSEDGIYNLNYTLPSIITGKDYTVVISCADETKTLFSVNVEINSSIISVSVSGDIQVADNVKLETYVHTTNSDLINKNATITSNKSISTTIPNLVANMSCYVTLRGYEMVAVEQQPEENTGPVFTKLEGLRIEWICSATGEIFYSAGGNLYRFDGETETKILENAEAKFMVSYGDYVYFSNMRKNGKIYCCNKDGSNLTLVSQDSGSWLYIKNGKLYYKDNGSNREEKCVNIFAE